MDFGKKSTLKKHPFKEKKAQLAKKGPISQKALLEQKKALSKDYFINKKQQESTYNYVIQLVLYLCDKVSQGNV